MFTNAIFAALLLISVSSLDAPENSETLIELQQTLLKIQLEAQAIQLKSQSINRKSTLQEVGLNIVSAKRDNSRCLQNKIPLLQ